MILCLTHSGDYYTIDLVMKALQRAGYKTFRLNTDQFNQEQDFWYRIGTDGTKVWLRTPEGELSADQVQAVWNRKVWPIATPSDLDEQFNGIFRQEYATYRQIFFRSCASVPWFNPEAADQRIAGDKLLQLELAKSAGLLIPESLFSAEQEAIRHFFYQVCKGAMIAKLHGTLSYSMSGKGPAFPTTLIREQDLDALDAVAYCPMIFQEYIEKAYELRIAYVDGLCFAGKLRSPDHVTDWRTQSMGEVAWEPYELPVALQEKLCTLMQTAGLAFGLIDMICRPGGDYIFLEVNPKGEWGMLQKFLNLPIAETIAQKLIEKIS